MPRRPSLAPTSPYKIYLNQENAAMLELLAYDPSTKRHAFGRVSELANEAFTLLFETMKEKASCQQPTSNPDLPSSAP